MKLWNASILEGKPCSGSLWLTVGQVVMASWNDDRVREKACGVVSAPIEERKSAGLSHVTAIWLEGTV